MNDFQPLTVISGRDPLPTPALDHLSAWSNDVLTALAVENMARQIARMKDLCRADVITLLAAIKEAADGDSCTTVDDAWGKLVADERAAK